MKRQTSIALLLAFVPLAHAASTQIGDLRLPSGTYSGVSTYFDPGFGPHATRTVAGAPVQLVSDFQGTSQNAGDASADSSTDLGLQTFSSATSIRQLNRYGADPDGPANDPNGPKRVGAVQWTIDLSALDSYLSVNNLALTALDLRMVANLSGGSFAYDMYLSYGDAGAGTALTSIDSADPATNYGSLWLPSQGVSEGSIVGGTHQLWKLGVNSNSDLSTSLLALYNSGIRDVNLIMASGAFGPSRTIAIADGSGLSIDTVPIPEPATSFLAIFATFGLLRRRR